MIGPLTNFRLEKLTKVTNESAICDLYFILLQLNFRCYFSMFSSELKPKPNS